MQITGFDVYSDDVLSDVNYNFSSPKIVSAEQLKRMHSILRCLMSRNRKEIQQSFFELRLKNITKYIYFIEYSVHLWINTLQDLRCRCASKERT